jgi:hypothetical protein
MQPKESLRPSDTISIVPNDRLTMFQKFNISRVNLKVTNRYTAQVFKMPPGIKRKETRLFNWLRI